MAGGASNVMTGTVPIAELVDTCEHMAAANQALFERLGEWVTDEPDPAAQQWFGVACHRHAWHAELWSERRPKIPVDPTADADVTTDDPGDRAAWYSEHIARLQERLAELEVRVDPVLDPATTRVIRLVAADLADLATSAPTTPRPR
jgi:hypothetical protein